MKQHALLFFVFCMSLFYPLHATTISVTTSGASSGSTQPYNITYGMTQGANGDTLLLAAGTYTSGLTFPTAKTLTLKAANGVAASSVILNGVLGGATTTNYGGLIYDGITIDLSGTSNNYYISTGLGNISILAFRNCTIQNIPRCILRTTSSGYILTNLELTNCIVTGCGSGGYNLFYPYHNVQNFTVRNNTLKNYTNGESFFYQNFAITANGINFIFENNTVYKWGKDDTRAICNTRTTYPATSNYTFRNNIFSEPGVTLLPKLITATGGNLLAENNLVVNYGTYVMTTPTSSSITDLTLNTGALAGQTTIGFADPTNGDFSIASNLPLATAGAATSVRPAGGIVGDPRWLKSVSAPATITTSVYPSGAGTTTPNSSTVNVGDNVTVTATNGFGYAFNCWRDKTTLATVSTQKSYTFSISANTDLEAVFDVVTTYNFTLNKIGSGGSWGQVTLTPPPTGGKYETGTKVVMTASNNLISTFNKWDDESVALTRAEVTVTGDVTYTAAFTANPFITAWDFNPSEPRSARSGDYNYANGVKGTMNFYATTGSTTSWGGSTISGKTCARRYTDLADMPAKCRSFRAEVSTMGYQSIQVSSKIAFDNNLVHANQLMQFSTDGTNYIDVASVQLTGKSKNTWYSFNASLPATANNASKIYIRWIGDVSSSLVGSITSETTEGFYLTDVVLSGTTIAKTASGDYIATTAGDFNTAANWSISDGTGILGTASNAPTASTNVWIPAGFSMTNSTSASCKDLNILGTYTASAALEVTGNLYIKSDAKGTGTLLDNGNLTVTGSTIAEQYLTSGRNWYVSSPVSGATAASINTLTGSYLASYDEPHGSTAPWITESSTLTPGKGYVVVSPVNLNPTIQFSGHLNTGDQPVVLTRTAGQANEGFNLVGNPYPSNISWTEALATASNTMSTIWYRTYVPGMYTFYTFNATGSIGSPEGVTGLIAPMQSFWVQVKESGGTLTFSNSMRSHSVTPNKLRSASVVESPLLRLKVSNGIQADEAVVYFNSDASNTFDAYDSPKMTNADASIPEIATLLGSEQLVINGLNQVSDNLELPLVFKTGQANTFTLQATSFRNFDSDARILLKDRLLNKVLDLTDGSTYTFTSDVTSTTSRFSLVFKTASNSTGLDRSSTSVGVVCSNSNRQLVVHLTDSKAENASICVHNSLGQEIGTFLTKGSNTTLMKQFEPGIYLVSITVKGSSTMQKVIIK